MTAAFWWYVLAGFMVGFCASTAWEWLYFRQRRMRITDRRIAELQQALRAQARTEPAVEVLPQVDVTWSATEYRSPGVFMETEAKGEHAEAEPTAQGSSSGELAKAAAVIAVARVALAPEDELGVATALAAVEEDSTTDVTAASGAAEQATMDDGGADLTQAPAEDSAAAAVEEDSATVVAAAPPQVTTQAGGLSAGQGYQASEQSPSEFAAVPVTEKARFAVKQAWEKTRALTDILRST